MDDNYYRMLIDKARQSEQDMWEGSDDSDEGYDAFEKLWEILSEDDGVSAETFMKAAELCLTSFFGSERDHRAVWQSVADRYSRTLDDHDDNGEFKESFIAFADTYSECEDPDCVSQFTEMMHAAIKAGDAEMAAAVTTCAFCPQIWTEDDAYPEWSVWFAVFSDKDFSDIPKSPQAASAIKELYSCLGKELGMERLGSLYGYYFGGV